MRSRVTALRFIVFVVGLIAAGCASSRIVHQWSNPDIPSPPRFKRIMVTGISQQPGIRRSFEDEFVAKLKASGVDAVPSYRFIPEDGPVDEPRLREAVRQAGADALLVTRLVRVEQKTQVSPGYGYPYYPYYPYYPGFGFYRGYADAWPGYSEPMVYQYDVYVSETTLYNTASNQPVWSGTVETMPQGISKDISHYVDTVIKALKDKKLLAAA